MEVISNTINDLRPLALYLRQTMQTFPGSSACRSNHRKKIVAFTSVIFMLELVKIRSLEVINKLNMAKFCFEHENLQLEKRIWELKLKLEFLKRFYFIILSNIHT